MSLLSSAGSTLAAGGRDAVVIGESVERVRLALGILSLGARASFCSACTTSALVTSTSTVSDVFHCEPSSSFTSAFSLAGRVQISSWALQATDERARAFPPRVLSTVAIVTGRWFSSVMRSRAVMVSRREFAFTSGSVCVRCMGSASLAWSSASTWTKCFASTGEKFARSAACAKGAMCLGESRASSICVRLTATYFQRSGQTIRQRTFGGAWAVELQQLQSVALL